METGYSNPSRRPFRPCFLATAWNGYLRGAAVALVVLSAMSAEASKVIDKPWVTHTFRGLALNEKAQQAVRDALTHSLSDHRVLTHPSLEKIKAALHVDAHLAASRILKNETALNEQLEAAHAQDKLLHYWLSADSTTGVESFDQDRARIVTAVQHSDLLVADSDQQTRPAKVWSTLAEIFDVIATGDLARLQVGTHLALETAFGERLDPGAAVLQLLALHERYENGVEELQEPGVQRLDASANGVDRTHQVAFTNFLRAMWIIHADTAVTRLEQADGSGQPLMPHGDVVAYLEGIAAQGSRLPGILRQWLTSYPQELVDAVSNTVVFAGQNLHDMVTQRRGLAVRLPNEFDEAGE